MVLLWLYVEKEEVMAEYHDVWCPLNGCRCGNCGSCAKMPDCPTPCDDDCEALCHEGHQVPFKRTHDPEECENGRVRD